MKVRFNLLFNNNFIINSIIISNFPFILFYLIFFNLLLKITFNKKKKKFFLNAFLNIIHYIKK